MRKYTATVTFTAGEVYCDPCERWYDGDLESFCKSFGGKVAGLHDKPKRCTECLENAKPMEGE